MTRMATRLLLLVAAFSLSVSAAELPPNMTTYYFGVLMKGPKWSAPDPLEGALKKEAK